MRNVLFSRIYPLASLFLSLAFAVTWIGLMSYSLLFLMD